MYKYCLLFLVVLTCVCAQSQLENITINYSATLFPVSTLTVVAELIETRFAECNLPFCISLTNSTNTNETCVNSCYMKRTTDVCDSPSTGTEVVNVGVTYNSIESPKEVYVLTTSSIASVIYCPRGDCSDEVLGFFKTTPEDPGSRIAIVFQNTISDLDDIANIILEITILITDELILFNPLTSIYGNYGCIPFGGAANADFPVTQAGQGSYTFSITLLDFQNYGAGNYYFFIENDHNYKSITAEYSYFWQVIRK